VNISNFTTSWSSGMAFCALLHSYDSSLLKYESLKSNQWEQNLALAFESAEKLGIPRLLDVEDMLISIPDPLSVATYVSEIYNFLNKKSDKESQLEFGMQLKDWAEDKFYESKQQLTRYTIQFTQLNSTSSSCALCLKPITGRVITHEKSHHHPNCFICSKCNRLLNKNFTVVDQKFFCEGCGRRAFVFEQSKKKTQENLY